MAVSILVTMTKDVIACDKMKRQERCTQQKHFTDTILFCLQTPNVFELSCPFSVTHAFFTLQQLSAHSALVLSG